MNALPSEIKYTFIIASAIMMLFVGFIVLIIFLYNKKQLFFLKEKQLNESEHQNQLLQKELERQKAIHEERERISHDMHDDLGAGISALKLQAEFLKKKVLNPDLYEDIQDIIKTSEEMNLSMREMLWSLNSSNDNLGNFAEYVISYVENFYFKTNIKVTTEKNINNPEKELSTEKRRNLFLCVKEAVNNSYKHSLAEHVSFTIKQETENLMIKLEDNGVGISTEKSNGNGLKNMDNRMKSCHGNLEIATSDSGTKIVFLAQL